jgi:hypothetical protein
MTRRIVIVLLGVALVGSATAIAYWHRNGVLIREAWNDTSSVVMPMRLPAMREYLRGRNTAREDIRKGCLRLKIWGLPAPSSAIFRDLLAKRYGVNTCRTAGCFVDPTQEAGWVGYNTVMLKEIDQRYGKKVLETVYRDAAKLFEERRNRGELPWQIVANHGRVIPL